MSEQELIIQNIQAIGFEGQNRPDNVNDDKAETRWSYQKSSVSGNPEDAWIVLDFDEEKTGIKSIGIHWYNPPSQMGRINTFEVQVSSDNINYNVVLPRRQSEGKNDLEIYKFDNEVNGRYVKVIGFGNSSNNWVSVNTIKVNPRIISIDPDPGIASTSDRFGVKKIYPTKPGTQELYMPNSQEINGNPYDNGIYYQQLNRIRGIGGEDTRSNDMHFKKSMVDQEVTGYFKFIQDMADVDVKLRGGHHSNSGDSSARCYIFTVKDKPFQKEFPHNGGKMYSMHNLRTRTPDDNRPYAPDEKIKFDIDFDSLRNSGRWLGFKGITINEGNGKVRCEMYIDTEGIDNNGNFDPNRQNWRLWYSILDEDGKYGVDIENERKTRRAWTAAQTNSTIQFRLDAETGNDDMTLTKNDFKFLSAREIVRP